MRIKVKVVYNNKQVANQFSDSVFLTSFSSNIISGQQAHKRLALGDFPINIFMTVTILFKK